VKALVTGGAGFIGSHIASRLRALGHDVRILDNLSSGRQENLDASPGAHFLRGDVTVTGDCEAACAGRDVVFHHAALVSVQESLDHPDRSFRINVGGTLNMLLAARKYGVKRFIFASSAAVYGDDPRLPKEESMDATPISPYGADKAAAEQYVLLAGRLWGLEPVVLRYFNVFGPRQDPNGEYAAVIPRFVARLAAGEPPTIFGDGRQTRDFLYIDDVVAANLLAVESPAAPGGIFNIARGEPVDLLGVLNILREATGLDTRPTHAPARVGDIVHSSADTRRAASLLGFSPATPLASGLKATADYFRRR
jgi:nucleoside-diphosphate-sugar epimerase